MWVYAFHFLPSNLVQYSLQGLCILPILITVVVVVVVVVVGGSNQKSLKTKRMKRKTCGAVSVANGFLHQEEPLLFFGSDIMLMILNRLDAKGIAVCLVVSRAWHKVASSDTLWTSRCKDLWLGKAHIPQISQVRRISRLAAYSLSVMDGKRASRGVIIFCISVIRLAL